MASLMFPNSTSFSQILATIQSTVSLMASLLIGSFSAYRLCRAPSIICNNSFGLWKAKYEHGLIWQDKRILWCTVNVVNLDMISHLQRLVCTSGFLVQCFTSRRGADLMKIFTRMNCRGLYCQTIRHIQLIGVHNAGKKCFVLLAIRWNVKVRPHLLSWQNTNTHTRFYVWIQSAMLFIHHYCWNCSISKYIVLTIVVFIIPDHQHHGESGREESTQRIGQANWRLEF